jgi:hypothetical protein
MLMWVLIWTDAPGGQRVVYEGFTYEACQYVLKHPPQPGHYRCELR